MPDVYDQFVKTADKLEKHYRDMQDIEFTIEKGKLFLLPNSIIPLIREQSVLQKEVQKVLFF